MKILRTAHKYYNSPPVDQSILVSDAGTFDGFCRGYLSASADYLVVQLGDNEMIVEMDYGKIVYRVHAEDE